MSERVLVVSPHRDDETIACGGTICAHVDRGDQVAVVHMCGQGGASSAEALAAARVLGVHDVSTLSSPPLQLEASTALLAELVAVFRRYRPSIAYVPHPADDDPTHQLTAKVAREARWAAAYPVLGEAGEQAESPAAVVYEYEVWTPLPGPSVFVDISAYTRRKIDALEQYSSQLEICQWADGALGLNRYRGVTSGCGAYAEAFTVVRAPHAIMWPGQTSVPGGVGRPGSGPARVG